MLCLSRGLVTPSSSAQVEGGRALQCKRCASSAARADVNRDGAPSCGGGPFDGRCSRDMMAGVGLTLTDDAIRLCASIFSRHPKYAVADSAIARLIGLLPTNNHLADVLTKVSVIKTLYATPVFDVVRLSQHICSIPNLDMLLSQGELTAADHIRKGHAIATSKGHKEIDFYSFATKYCSFHNPQAYPVYDNLVAGFIEQVHLQTGMASSRRDLRFGDYHLYKAGIDKVASRFGLAIPSYKELDKGLWIVAKYFKFNAEKATPDDRWVVAELQKEFAKRGQSLQLG